MAPRKHLSLVSSSEGSSTKKLPAPLVPSDVSLHELAYMPLDIMRLFASEFHARATDAEWRAGVTLWCKAWHQAPAGSLPNDDASLARLAELGRDVEGWKAIRTGAMRNWILCADGRLYHPVIAAKALCIWIERLISRRAAAAGNQKRWGSPGATAILDRQLLATLRSLKKLHGENKADDGVIGAIDKAERLMARSPIKTMGLDASPPDRDPIAPPFGSRSQREGEREGEKEGGENAISADPPTAKFDEPAAASPKPRRRRGTKAVTEWPEDFKLTDDLADCARKEGFDPGHLFEKFRNKALAKGWTYKDWAAGFRNFAQSEYQPRGQSGARPAGQHAWRSVPC